MQIQKILQHKSKTFLACYPQKVNFTGERKGVRLFSKDIKETTNTCSVYVNVMCGF